MSKLTLEQQDFVFKNYSSLGMSECSKILNVNQRAIEYFARKNNLFIIGDWRKRNNINIELWETMSTPQVCYMLGIILADGWIDKKRVSLSLVEQDFDEIRETFSSTYSKCCISKRQRKHWKPAIHAAISSTDLVKLLVQRQLKNNGLNYMRYIPSHYLKYFIRGYIDGDGHIGFRKYTKTNDIILEFSGPYDFDWNCLENLFSTNNFNYNISRYINKKGHKYSKFSIYKNSTIISFLNFVYEGRDNDKIGFTRKYQIYTEIKKHCSISPVCKNEIIPLFQVPNTFRVEPQPFQIE